MYNLVHTLNEFKRAVLSGAAVRLYVDGHWTVAGFFLSLFLRLFAFGRPLYVDVAIKFATILDKLETIPVRFSAAQTIDYSGYLAAAEAIVERITESKNKSAINAKMQLLRRIVALRYRLEAVNGGLDREEAFPSDILELTMQAKIWKQGETIFHHQQLSYQDTEKLLETARYRRFTALLLSNTSLRSSYFTYALRDCQDIDFFIQFPALQQLLQISNLQGRIGRMGCDSLKIERRPIDVGDGVEKIVTLPFEGKAQSILNPMDTV